MRNILLLGSGKSSTVLIDYLMQHADEESWRITIADADLSLAQKKIAGSLKADAVYLDIRDDESRKKFIEDSDLVISLLPPHLHYIVAVECLHLRKHLLTASYISNEIKELSPEISKAGLLFLCEMGLDPGIDHMSAKNIIDSIQSNGGHINSFISHCGGLIAPESDNNPWHYKISWNPRNVIRAGKEGAVYKQNESIIQLPYKEVFSQRRDVFIGPELFSWYPNRDSLPYAALYGLEDCPTFIRTTLRHPDFIYGWNNLIELRFTDDSVVYDTDGKTLQELFQEHLKKNEFDQWLEKKIHNQFQKTQELLNNLIDLNELEQLTSENGIQPIKNFMVVSDQGNLKDIDIHELKNDAASVIASKLHESKLTLSQLIYLGMNDQETLVNRGKCSAPELLQFAIERKLAMQEEDKDRIIMLHEIDYMIDDVNFRMNSLLDINGKNRDHTAMATTVGLPLGIAAKMILNGRIQKNGLHIPISKDIYEPVLRELKSYHIDFEEHTYTRDIS